MTDCLNPTAPSDEELLRYCLDGEVLSAEASRHLKQCSICQQRVVSYKNIHISLVSRLYRSQCPESTKLSLYCANLLPSDERLSIANHLLECPLCATEAEDTRQFLAQPDKDLLPSPSFSLPGLHEAIYRTFGILVKKPVQTVVRGDVAETAWPRQYRSDSVDLSLHLSRPSNGEYVLLGIISDPTVSTDAFQGVAAELYPAEGGKDSLRSVKPLLSEHVDDIGIIVFSAVPVGDYVMIVRLHERELVIEGVNIQPG